MHQLLARLFITSVITTTILALPSHALDALDASHATPQQPAGLDALTEQATLTAPNTLTAKPDRARQDLTALSTNANATCPVPTTFSAPSSENRTIELEDWQIIFSMPANYRTHRTASTVQIFSPEGYEHLQCLLSETTADIDPINSNALSSISISSVTGNLTEEDILSWAEEESGELLGTTEMANEYHAFVHTRNSSQASAMVLSLPTGEGITFVLSTPLNESGDVLHPDAFHMVAGTFMFHLGWYEPLESTGQNKQVVSSSSNRKQGLIGTVSTQDFSQKS